MIMSELRSLPDTPKLNTPASVRRSNVMPELQSGQNVTATAHTAYRIIHDLMPGQIADGIGPRVTVDLNGNDGFPVPNGAVLAHTDELRVIKCRDAIFGRTT